MEFDSTYQTKELEIKLVYPSNIYQRVGEVYKLLGDNELTLEYYSKALDALNDEVRPDKILKQEGITRTNEQTLTKESYYKLKRA